MTQEEKGLLLKVLCELLPYGVMCEYKNEVNSTIKPILLVDVCRVKTKDGFVYWDCYFEGNGGQDIPVEMVRPYLRPMSSMTEEERLEFSKLLDRRYCEEDWEGHISTSYCIEIDNVYTDDEGIIKYPSSFSMDAIDWLNAHYFDYRGLIKKGLALEVPENMYGF